MVPQGNKRIRTRIVPELEANRGEYLRLCEDMVQHGGALIADPNWLFADDYSRDPGTYDKRKAMEFALSEKGFSEKFSKMTALMKSWIGCAQPLSQAYIAQYRRFLAQSDVLRLWEPNVEESKDGSLVRGADLGSIMDLNLLYVFSARPERKVTRLLEVGGGYGRLAEAAFNVFGPSLKYVLVDAVPASLYYSRNYLIHACPAARVGSFYDGGGDEFNPDDYDIAIIPAWHFERLNRSFYDVCVNIESMQEMRQEHVDYYLSMFQAVAADGATIYLSNAHDYYFRGAFNYPKNWQLLFCSNTPRSWTRYHPTEIFRKTTADHSAENSVHHSTYSYGLWLHNDPEKFISRIGVKRMIIPMLKAMARAARSRLKVRSRIRQFRSRLGWT